MSNQQAAFLSYSQKDDQSDGQFISKLREKLSLEVRAQTGQAFEIFQDKFDLAVGNNWRRTVYETLDKVIFLIPIMTPSFFKSEACREEVAYFAQREQRLGRDDLMLPIYYIDCEVVRNSGRREDDPEAALLYERFSNYQHSDWRNVRGSPISAQAVRKKTIQMANDIVRRLDDRDLQAAFLEPAADSSDDPEPGSVPPASEEANLDPASSNPSLAGRLHLVPPMEAPTSPWLEFAYALSRVDLTMAEPSFLAVRTREIRALLRLDYPQLKKNDEKISYIKDELSRTIDSLVMGRATAAENSAGCRAAERLCALLISLLAEAL